MWKRRKKNFYYSVSSQIGWKKEIVTWNSSSYIVCLAEAVFNEKKYSFLCISNTYTKTVIRIYFWNMSSKLRNISNKIDIILRIRYVPSSTSLDIFSRGRQYHKLFTQISQISLNIEYLSVTYFLGYTIYFLFHPPTKRKL